MLAKLLCRNSLNLISAYFFHMEFPFNDGEWMSVGKLLNIQESRFLGGQNQSKQRLFSKIGWSSLRLHSL